MATTHQRSPARDLLLAMLADGARPTTEVEAEAARRGIAKRSVERGRRALGVIAERRGVGRGSKWWLSLPPGTNTHQKRYVNVRVRCSDCGSYTTYPIEQ